MRRQPLDRLAHELRRLVELVERHSAVRLIGGAGAAADGREGGFLGTFDRSLAKLWGAARA
ncbi:MAG: hypothetical protein ABL957_12055 [Parvularculaceae bacterium]